ncbi:MAG: ABC transporter ATP-binding protein [Deferrisomatales bacterium]|nr:ABC transporter ATP-binding protein [Deferrisomatales bacterium]
MRRETCLGPAVVLADVSKSFGNGPVVADVSFAVEPGTCFGLLGINGAGKSTTLKMIHGFLRPEQGSIRVNGIDVLRRPREARRWMGVAPQDDTLDPDLGVAQNLEFHGRYSGLAGAVRRQRVAEMLELAELTEQAGCRVFELSTGMRRRLVLVRALLNQPRVLLLDEPTRGLDLESRNRYLNTLRELKQEGVTLLMATHELAEAEALCDRGAILEGGRVVRIGSGADVVGVAKGRSLLPAEEAG